jgi:predicted branched-subunit amino acid permease
MSVVTQSLPTEVGARVERSVADRAGVRRTMLEGARDITPMVIGVAPFGLAIGAAIGASSVGTAEGLASGPAIFAGAAQLSVIQMLDSGVTPAVIVLSALMINARLLLYSASLASWFRGSSLPQRLLLAIPVIDQLYFTCGPRFEQGDLDRRGRVAYYSGAASFLTSTWVATQAVAIVAGARVPESVGLHVAAPLALAGLLAKSLADGKAIAAAVCGGVVAVIGVGLPYSSAVLVATLCGVAAGTALDHAAARRGEGPRSRLDGAAVR